MGPPRVLQTIAEDNILPVMKPFAKKVDIYFADYEKYSDS